MRSHLSVVPEVVMRVVILSIVFAFIAACGDGAALDGGTAAESGVVHGDAAAGCAGLDEACGSAACCEGLLCMGPMDPLLRRCASP